MTATELMDNDCGKVYRRRNVDVALDRSHLAIHGRRSVSAKAGTERNAIVRPSTCDNSTYLLSTPQHHHYRPLARPYNTTLSIAFVDNRDNIAATISPCTSPNLPAALFHHGRSRRTIRSAYHQRWQQPDK